MSDYQELVTKEFRKRVNDLINSSQVADYAEIIKKLEWNKSSMSSVMNGSRNVPLDIWAKFAEVYNVQITPKSNHITTRNHLKDIGDSKRGTMVYESAPVQAGIRTVYHDEHAVPDYVLNIPQFRDCNYGTRASGDSMYPEIRNGDLIVCKELPLDARIIFGDIYVVHTKDGMDEKESKGFEDFLKRVKNRKPTPFYFVPSTNELKHFILLSFLWDEMVAKYPKSQHFKKERDKIRQKLGKEGVLKHQASMKVLLMNGELKATSEYKPNNDEIINNIIITEEGRAAFLTEKYLKIDKEEKKQILNFKIQAYTQIGMLIFTLASTVIAIYTLLKTEKELGKITAEQQDIRLQLQHISDTHSTSTNLQMLDSAAKK